MTWGPLKHPHCHVDGTRWFSQQERVAVSKNRADQSACPTIPVAELPYLRGGQTLFQEKISSSALALLRTRYPAQSQFRKRPACQRRYPLPPPATGDQSMFAMARSM